MKKLLVIMLSVGLAVSASAQKGHGGHGGIVAGHGFAPSHLSVGIGVFPAYGHFGYGPWFGYPYYDYPYNGYPRSLRLDLQIEDIKLDYKDRIWSVRHDESLSRKEKRKTIRNLKAERDREIIDARLNYYKSHRY